MAVVSPVRPSPLVKLKETLTTSCFHRDNRGRVWGLVCVLLLGQSTMPLNAQPDSSVLRRYLSSSSSSSFLCNRSSITPLSSKSPRSLAPICESPVCMSVFLLYYALSTTSMPSQCSCLVMYTCSTRVFASAIVADLLTHHIACPSLCANCSQPFHGTTICRQQLQAPTDSTRLDRRRYHFPR
eukprot:GHVS01107133.1.p2 GENE.GHVS01107133.1~~GHVS01107133.1.p2  ORF type:complete len:190 (+),score=21.10 GHVS01107133.1:22-570(+)